MGLGWSHPTPEAPGTGDCTMAGFSVALSGGTLKECREKGAISADGATATTRRGVGYFRAVFEAVARGGDVWEGAMRFRGSDVVYLFISIGAPNADTDYNSRNVLSKRVDTRETRAWARGAWGGAGVGMVLPVGGTLSWRIDCAAGLVHARVGDGAWAAVFKEKITPAEVAEGLYAGVLLGDHMEAQLLSYDRVDGAPDGVEVEVEVATSA